MQVHFLLIKFRISSRKYHWQKMAGDFPMVLYEVISKRSNVMEGTLTIDRLNNLLDELAKAGGNLCAIKFYRITC